MTLEKRAYRLARKKINAKKRFRKHFSTYLSVSVFLILLNLLTDGGEFWAIFPILGWGLAVFMHYTKVHGFPGLKKMDEEWEQEELKKELRQLYRSKESTPKQLASTDELPDYGGKTALPDYQEFDLDELDEITDLIKEKNKSTK